jgi:hypothetical protein
MIDIENLVYTNIRNAIKLFNQGISVSGTYADVPSSFPHVSIEETDNASVAGALSTSDREYAVNLTYTANIYTNTATAKSDAKAIAEVVSDAFAEMGFVRSMKQEMPNIDRTIYRLILRFQGTAWKGYDGVDGHYNITAR